MTDRITKVKYDGKTYHIPDIWLLGQTVNRGRTTLEAIEVWAYQQELQERFDRQQEGERA